MYAPYAGNGKIRQFFFLYGAGDENYSPNRRNLVRQLNEEVNNSAEKVRKIVVGKIEEQDEKTTKNLRLQNEDR
jgi:hypothetical protein